MRIRKKSCSVPNCPFEGIPGRSFHEFPSKEIMRKKWLRKIRDHSGITLDLSGTMKYVCGGHFEKEDCSITKNNIRRLKTDSVPTIFTNRSERDRCAAKNCTSSTNDGTKLFWFPSDEKMCLKWTKICKRGDSWCPTTNSRLCSLHFSEDQFKQSRTGGSTVLKPNAVPTISVDDIRGKNQLKNFVILPENLDESDVINDVTFISTEDYDNEKPASKVQNGVYDTEKLITDESSTKLGNERSEEIIIKIEPDHDESLVEKYELLKQEHDDLKRKYETLQKLYTEERGKIALLMLQLESGRCSNKQLQDILKSKK